MTRDLLCSCVISVLVEGILVASLPNPIANLKAIGVTDLHENVSKKPSCVSNLKTSQFALVAITRVLDPKGGCLGLGGTSSRLRICLHNKIFIKLLFKRVLVIVQRVYHHGCTFRASRVCAWRIR